MSLARDFSEEIKHEGIGKQEGEFRLLKLISCLQPAFVLFDKKATQNSKLQCHLLRFIKIKYFCCNWQEIYLYLAYFVCVGCVADKSDLSSSHLPTIHI